MSESPHRCVRCLEPVPSRAAECPSCQARVVSQMAIGQILVEEGRLRQQQLEEALEQQRGTGRRLGNILTDRGWITEREFAETLARQLDVPFFDLTDYMIDAAVVSLLPDHICERYRLVPLMKTGEKLVIAMADPLNHDALADIQLLTGLAIKVVVATPGDVNRALAEAFDALSTSRDLATQLFPQVPRPPEPVRLDRWRSRKPSRSG